MVARASETAGELLASERVRLRIKDIEPNLDGLERVKSMTYGRGVYLQISKSPRSKTTKGRAQALRETRKDDEHGR